MAVGPLAGGHGDRRFVGVDCTNPEAWRWYADKLRPTRKVETLVEMGVDCFKTDAPRSVWATFESMAESLRGGLSLCTSGFGFWSHDIGWFGQTASAIPTESGAVYKRWCAFGLLSSHSRLHGSSSYRVSP